MLHVELCAPPGSDEENQQFWLNAKNSKLYMSYPGKSKRFYVGAKTTPSPVAGLLSSTHQYYMPILLPYEPSTIRLTAYETRSVKSKKLWSREIAYALPESHFPRHELSPSWVRLNDKTLVLAKAIDEIAKEIPFTDPKWKSKVLELGSAAEQGITVRLEINKSILKGTTNQPLTCARDRVYTLEALGIIIDPGKFKSTS